MFIQNKRHVLLVDLSGELLHPNSYYKMKTYTCTVDIFKKLCGVETFEELNKIYKTKFRK